MRTPVHYRSERTYVRSHPQLALKLKQPSTTHSFVDNIDSNLLTGISRTLQQSATYIISASQATPPSLLTLNTSVKPSIRGFVLLNALSMAGNVIVTLFLFTKSDLKTILIPVVSGLPICPQVLRITYCPQSVFAALSQPNASPGRVAASVFWTWLHLLQCCTSNQTTHPAEDLRNKPWRPICSKRIAMEHALLLRWSLLPLCLIQSYSLGVPWQGLSLSLGVVVYNELGFGSHWFSRTLCNVWGYVSFNYGAVGILSGTSINRKAGRAKFSDSDRPEPFPSWPHCHFHSSQCPHHSYHHSRSRFSR